MVTPTEELREREIGDVFGRLPDSPAELASMHTVESKWRYVMWLLYTQCQLPLRNLFFFLGTSKMSHASTIFTVISAPKPGIYEKSPTSTDYYCLHILIRTISATEAAENVFCVCIAWYKNERGSRQVCKTRDEVKRLHNCQEFSQPLECLYQAMQT